MQLDLKISDYSFRVFSKYLGNKSAWRDRRAHWKIFAIQNICKVHWQER